VVRGRFPQGTGDDHGYCIQSLQTRPFGVITHISLDNASMVKRTGPTGSQRPDGMGPS
jgi:hypothetical protein